MQEPFAGRNTGLACPPGCTPFFIPNPGVSLCSTPGYKSLNPAGSRRSPAESSEESQGVLQAPRSPLKNSDFGLIWSDLVGFGRTRFDFGLIWLDSKEGKPRDRRSPDRQSAGCHSGEWRSRECHKWDVSFSYYEQAKRCST